MYDFVTKKSRKYAEFIIGIDDDGNEIMHTCNPDELGDSNLNISQNMKSYLTLIHFRRAVLDTYYSEPSKFTVGPSLLSCGHWTLPIGISHSGDICAFLGDLGRHLPMNEQLHWQRLNFAPTGRASSKFCKQEYGDNSIDQTERLGHRFRYLYATLEKNCDRLLGWRLLKQLDKKDHYHLSSIRALATEEPKSFGNQVLSLAIILVDSLHKNKLITFITSDDLDTKLGSIECLNKAFEHLNVSGYEDHIEFLRKLQSLRSTGVAHRKGGDYKKNMKKMGLDDSNLITSSSIILARANKYLLFLINIVQDGVFDPKDT